MEDILIFSLAYLHMHLWAQLQMLADGSAFITLFSILSGCVQE